MYEPKLLYRSEWQMEDYFNKRDSHLISHKMGLTIVK